MKSAPILLLLFIWTLCSQIIDHSSYANINQVQTTHLDLNLLVDFDQKILKGYVQLTMRTKQSISEVALDLVGLVIHKIQLVNRNLFRKRRQLKYDISEPNTKIGKKLSIEINSSRNKILRIRIYYNTVNDRSQRAINWLEASQTAGKKLPYLFSQCQSINCRSLAPIQDTPSIKATYFSVIKVDKQFGVQMSARQTKVQVEGDWKIFRFEQRIKISSYLIALAVGDIEYQKLGERVGVISEPIQLKKAGKCLEHLEKYLKKTEEYLIDYVWGNYTILILPPSFPYGGMENPLMTFVSPTIITDDQQQMYVAVHEIVHSWTGNLVTNRNWTCFWLNEGFTVFVERTISEQLFGTEFRKIQEQIGYNNMVKTMEAFGFEHSYSSLTPQIRDDNPDEMFSVVPYEKGYFFIRYLESLTGKHHMQYFLKFYLNKFKYQSISTDDFIQTFQQYCLQNKIDISKVDWDLWINKPGVPVIIPDMNSVLLNKTIQLSEKYINREQQIDYSIFEDHLFSSLKVLFIEHLGKNTKQIDLQVLERIDKDLKISDSSDPDVKQCWFSLAISLGQESMFSKMVYFVSEQGRMKYIRPIYKGWLDNGYTELARQTFQANIDFYHPIAIKVLNSIFDKYQ